jgi:hypothetical protein
MLSPSELYHASAAPPAFDEPNDLEEPLLGPDELDAQGRATKVPVRLQVYHGRFGHWEREGLRKYKGELTASVTLTEDSGFLALWLTSLLGVIIGLGFVWGSTDVRDWPLSEHVS